MINSKQAAQRINLTPDALRKAAKKGDLPAVKVGRDWLFETEDVDAYAAREKNKGGRPRKAT